MKFGGAKIWIASIEIENRIKEMKQNQAKASDAKGNQPLKTSLHLLHLLSGISTELWKLFLNHNNIENAYENRAFKISKSVRSSLEEFKNSIILAPPLPHMIA